jgi:acetyl-CoA synthetase
MPNQGDVYAPTQDIIDEAHVPDYDALRAEAAADPLAFWDKMARELDWYQPWTDVLDESKAPFFKWFVGGKTNIVLNALDRHQSNATRNRIALIWEGEDGTLRTFSYFALNREVCQFANVLKSMGVARGDRVTIYMPRIPEQMMAMLACAKIGAVHSVVYGGFSVEALAGRIEDSESRVLITSDGGYLRGKIVPLKEIADEALRRCGTVEHVVVVRRTGEDVAMETERDYFYDELMMLPIARGSETTCSTEEMDAEDPLFMLYTSGTTGKPKAIVHTHGGYQVGIATTLKYAFDLKPEDRWWCAADAGWITGHSYIVYGPLILGATSVMYEGAPTYPYPDRWWRVVERYGVSILYTAPTAIRGLMRFGESWVKKRDTSTLRLLGSVGEPINPEAWRWYYEVVGESRCPIIDTWWQTETGAFMITPVPSLPLKPGSGTKPFPGIQAEVLDEDGNQVPTGEEGLYRHCRSSQALAQSRSPEFKLRFWTRMGIRCRQVKRARS